MALFLKRFLLMQTRKVR